MTLSPNPIRAWVDVDLAALVANARAVAAICGSRLLPMVKANGYGLGAAAVARALESVDPWGFGVACPEEGAALRAAGIRRPILVATPLVPQEIHRYVEHDLRPSIGDSAALAAWVAHGERPFHLEIDTGMSRAGARWSDRVELGHLSRMLAQAPGWEGIFTHFVAAESDSELTEHQWNRFHQVLRSLPRRPSLVHAANSAAALQGKCYAADLVRPGIFLYGGAVGKAKPRPVAALRARVIAIRSIAGGETVGYGPSWRAATGSTIATVSLGYADGFPRSAANRDGPQERELELNGRVVPVVGRVTMDMCMVAVGPGVAIGDVATIYGGLVTLDRQAELAGMLSYELLTGIGARVVRRYQGPG